MLVRLAALEATVGMSASPVVTPTVRPNSEQKQPAKFSSLGLGMLEWEHLSNKNMQNNA